MLIQEETVRLPAHFRIEHELRDQLSTRTGHQTCLEGRGELLLVLHDVPKPGVAKREGLYFWKSHDARWAQPSGAGLSGVGELLDRYENVIDGHEDRITVAESAAEIFAILRHSGPLSRSSRNMVRALELALRAEPDDRHIRVLLDRAREMERAADLLNSDARVALDYWQAERLEHHGRLLERIEKNSGRTNLLVGIFLPVIAAVGFFGMNPQMLHSFRYPLLIVVLAAMAVAGWRIWQKMNAEKIRRASASRRNPVPQPQANEGTPMEVSESVE